METLWLSPLNDLLDELLAGVSALAADSHPSGTGYPCFANSGLISPWRKAGNQDTVLAMAGRAGLR